MAKFRIQMTAQLMDENGVVLSTKTIAGNMEMQALDDIETEDDITGYVTAEFNTSAVPAIYELENYTQWPIKWE
jgi:hypothetical protein